MFSHPNIKLIDHLNGVMKIGLEIYNSKINLNLGFAEENINIALKNMLFLHDLGKATIYFQKYLQQAMTEEEITVDKKLRQHALISAIYSSYKTYLETDNEILSMIVFETIKRHHGDLNNINEELIIGKDSWKILEQQFKTIDFSYFNLNENISLNDLKDFEDDVLYEIDIDDFTDKYFYILNFFFSILTYSDKTEAIFHKNNTKYDIPENINQFISNYKNIKFKNSKKTDLNILRKEIYDLIEDRFLNYNKKIISIDVPTGSGKTLSVLNISFKALKFDNSIRRVIYALPFTSIIDQISEILEEVFKINGFNSDNYLTIHHHLTETKFNLTENYSVEGDKALFLIENWDKPIILTTFWQIFNSILTNKNGQLRKFHNLSNSIIVFDEIQAVPYEYWGLIKEILNKLTEILNCKIILMTATMPLIFLEEKNEVFPLINLEHRKKYFNIFSRYNLSIINNLNALNIDQLSKKAIEHINQETNKSFLFVFNTIKSSLLFYKILEENFINKNLIYLSTNIIPIDRVERIEKIKNEKKRKIVVSTQLIEAGVDIDLDIVYRDFAPLDNIVQTSGRCNRNNQEAGKVFLFTLQKDEANRKDSDYIYSKLNLIPTKNIFKEKNSFKESELLIMINKYYKELNKRSSKNISDSLKKDIIKLNYEDLHNNFKLIKNIPSVTVFIEKNEESTIVLNKFKALSEIENRFERKNEFLKFRKEFYNYTISVKITPDKILDIKNFEELGFLKVITKDMIDIYYKEDIGYDNEFNNFI